MDNYVNENVCTYENFDYNGKCIHAVIRIRDGEDKLALLVLDISNKKNLAPVPSSDRIDVSRSIRRQMLERSQDVKKPRRVREIFQILLNEDIYFINDKTDAGKVFGNQGVYARG